VCSHYAGQRHRGERRTSRFTSITRHEPLGASAEAGGPEVGTREAQRKRRHKVPSVSPGLMRSRSTSMHGSELGWGISMLNLSTAVVTSTLTTFRARRCIQNAVCSQTAFSLLPRYIKKHWARTARPPRSWFQGYYPAARAQI
jgi:hypothetical protein